MMMIMMVSLFTEWLGLKELKYMFILAIKYYILAIFSCTSLGKCISNEINLYCLLRTHSSG